MARVGEVDLDSLKQAVQMIDKAAQKGVIKRETASRLYVVLGAFSPFRVQ